MTNEGRIESLFTTNHSPIVFYEFTVRSAVTSGHDGDRVGDANAWQPFITPYYQSSSQAFLDRSHGTKRLLSPPPPYTPSIQRLPFYRLPIQAPGVEGTSPSQPPTSEGAVVSSPDATRIATPLDGPLPVTGNDPPNLGELPRGEGGVESLVSSVAVQAIPISSDRLSAVSVPAHIAQTDSDAFFRAKFLRVNNDSTAIEATSVVTNEATSPHSSTPSNHAPGAATVPRDSQWSPDFVVTIRGPEAPLVFEHDSQQYITTTVKGTEYDPPQKELLESADTSHTMSGPHTTSFIVSAMFNSAALREKSHPAAMLIIIGVLWTQVNHRSEKHRPPNQQPTRWSARRLTD
ncbi:MAG: hypothetical protein AAFU85_13140 [Planctomycetota bacterium]